MSLTRSIAVLDIYWLIHNTTCMMGYCGPSVKTAYPLLRQSEPLTAIDDTLPRAKFLGMQPRREFDNFTAMELVATPEETEAFGGGDSFLLIPEGRAKPLRLTNASNGDFPVGWLGSPAIGDRRHDAAAVLGGEAQPGEWFAMQLGVWARSAAVEVMSLEMSGDETLVQNFSCISLGGHDYTGARFSKPWGLPAGRTSSLWMGVQLPLTATTLQGHLTVVLRHNETVINATVPVKIEVSGAAAVNAGDNDPSKLTRLRWLDSRIGINDRVPAPFTPVDTSAWKQNRTLRILGRSLTIGASGLPQDITAVRKIGSGIFALSGWTFAPDGPALSNQTRSEVSWTARGTDSSVGCTINVTGSLSFEGYLDMAISISAAKPTTLPDFSVSAVLRAPYLAGLGRAGRKLGAAAWPLANIPPTGATAAAASGCAENNSLPLQFKWNESAAPMLWVGDMDGGMRIKWKGPGTAWDNPAFQGVASWANGGAGTFTVTNASSAGAGASDLVRVVASTGPLKLDTSAPVSFHFDLCITPFKPREVAANEHFQSRYFQIGYPDHHMYTPEQVAQTGATIASECSNSRHAVLRYSDSQPLLRTAIHQGVDSLINPYINWPFVRVVLSRFYALGCCLANWKGITIRTQLRSTSSRTFPPALPR